MKNLFSSPPDLQKLFQINSRILEQVQTELRFQRHENAQILSILNRLLNDSNLKKQVEEYYDPEEHQPGISVSTSPQTDTVEQ